MVMSLKARAPLKIRNCKEFAEPTGENEVAEALESGSVHSECP